MTNFEIIENAKNELGLDEDLILKTYQDWKRLGYQVKKGEKSVLACMIWFPKKSKVKNEVDSLAARVTLNELSIEDIKTIA